MGIRGITYRGLVALFLLAALLVSDTAMAQSRRERRRMEERRREMERRRTQPDRRPPDSRQPDRRDEEPVRPKQKKKPEVVYPRSTIKDVYRVDVLVALYLDELVKNDKPAFKGRIPDKAGIGLDFYQGIKLAADTLDAKNYMLEVYVHDITNPQESVKALLQNKRLDSTDLIIGAVQSNDIPMLADFAKRQNINFISALSPSDADVRENPYFTLLQPTLQTHCEWIMKKIAEKYHKEQISIFFRNSVPVDESAYGYLTNILEDNDLRKVACNTIPDSAAMAKIFSPAEDNVIIMPIVDNDYAESIIKKLYQYFPTYKFNVFGMPSWKTMGALRKADAFPNTAVYFTAPFYFDASTPEGQMFYTNYQNQFNGKPGEMVYRGFETLYWYATMLKEHGTIFNPEIKDNSKAPFTKFEIRTQWDKKKEEPLYNENQHLYLYRYQSSSYMVEQ